MKKALSFFGTIIIIMSMLVLTSCSGDVAKVESVLEIDSSFCGHRSITIKYPLSCDVDELEQKLSSENPLADIENARFEYLGVQQDGYTFFVDVSFSSRDEYKTRMTQLVGRDVSVYLSQPNTVFASGTRMTEDFDVSDIISWIVNISQENSDTSAVGFDYSANSVVINSELFSTGSTTDIYQLDGKPINSISIETTNQKDGTYDRSITFSIPNSTYNTLTGSIESYFSRITADGADYAGWTGKGSSWEYQVIYKSVDIDTMAKNTAMLLCTDSEYAFYGDKNNSGTPLSEGLTFEESFDTFGYIGTDSGGVKLEYKYALPTKTTHGDGTLLDFGKWTAVGVWEDGVYTLQPESDHIDIRIPDGIQYTINGIRFNLDVVDNNSFVRTTEFLYSKTQGYDGMNFAKRYFLKKGAQVECTQDDDNLICKVTCSGTAAEITDQLVDYFGSGNYMSYTSHNSPLSLSTKTKMTEYVNLGYMLNSINANRPISYTVSSDCNENIVSLVCDKSDANYSELGNSVLTVELSSGIETIVYEGNIPNTVNIIIYSVVCTLMLSATVVIVVLMMIKRRKKSKHSDTADKGEIRDDSISAATQGDTSYGDADDTDDMQSGAPQQTTTFSISELNVLSSLVDKKMREEIDKDVSEKMEADRLENLKKELKAQQIAELERKIYGKSDDTDQSDADSANTDSADTN